MRGRTETDPDACHGTCREIEGVLKQRALLLPLYHGRNTIFVRPEIESVGVNLFQPFVSYEKLFHRAGR